MNVFPNFLCIGVPKGGSTWLYELLNSHPEVWVPSQKREVHFFDNDRNFQKGTSWYEKFFPDKEEKEKYRAIGEITPHYLYLDARRIDYIVNNFSSIKNIILMVRNPVERLYSHYWFRKRMEGYNKEFEDFIEERPQLVAWGFYAKHLENWLQYFDRTQILILIFEEAVRNVPQTKKTVAKFLRINEDFFPDKSGEQKVNVRTMPRFHKAYIAACKIKQRFYAMDMYWLVSTAEKTGLKKLFGKRSDDALQEEISPETRKCLMEIYKQDIYKLERMFGTDLSVWRAKRMP